MRSSGWPRSAAHAIRLGAAGLFLLCLAGCDEDPAPSIGAAQDTIATGDLPMAYRTPQAMMQAMATGQLYERPPLCDGFVARDSDTGKEVDNLSALARAAEARAGKSPAAVLTQAVGFDRAAGTVTFLSTPVGSDGAPFRSEWTLRARGDGDRIECVERVLIEKAS
ncbi:hypothetical protein [Pacificimonas flava]|uniref:Lipoprotein n=1 Tax=Pacificimonas flava TaxID=1234595 RepID=M2TCA6_9SPHN|nr:hypothetical protein [Pacificimonas flava]EMD84269.1 hypothetical protein C725_0199 [Pacificimonas flava]MBB5279855.1 hypothetical protein [Pacificimonas flava]